MRTLIGRARRAPVALVAAAALLVAPLATGVAGAQDASAVEQARQHFGRGKQLFAASDYRGAIAEFAAADKLAPSPLLEFNIALCHERLGERSEAIRRYRLYLERVPDASNRAAVEAKIGRLEAEMKAEAEVKGVAPVPVPVPVPPAGAGGVTAAPSTPPAPTGPPPSGRAAPAETRPPAPASTGDPELDRVAKIDIGRLRAERQQAEARSTPPSAAGAPAGQPGSGATPSAPPPPADRPVEKKSKPIYKQWWFWVVVGVGTIVLINIATADSSSQDERTLVLPSGDAARAAPPAGGAVLLRF